MEPAFTELEESFFAEGDAMSAVPEEVAPDLSGIPEEIVDESPITRPYASEPQGEHVPLGCEKAPDLIGYYASLAIEADVLSGFFEAAA